MCWLFFCTSVLPPRLCLTCGFQPTFGYCAIGMYSDWVYHLNLNMIICCCHFISAFLFTEGVSADSGIPTSSQSPLRPGFPSYVTCVTRVVICVCCWFTHVCHGGSLHSWLPTGSVLHLCCWYQRAWSAMVKVVWAQYGVFGCAILPPSISGAGKVSLTTVCQWGNRRANCTGMYGGLFWFSRSALWHNSSNIGYIEWLFIYICLFLIKIWNYIYGIRYLSLMWP